MSRPSIPPSIRPPSTATRLTGSIGWITFATMAAAFMALADIAIVNLNLPQMQAAFSVEIDQLTWISTAYMVANVIAMPMTGWLQKRIGLRLSFLLSTVTFTVASALCGFAWSFETLVLFRIVQGLGGGGLLPLSQAVLGARYPQEKFELAGALFGVGALLGPVVGPFLGAEVLEHADWPWMFWINVPIGIVSAIVAVQTMKENRFDPRPAPFDARGAALLAFSLGGLQFVLEEGNRRDWFESSAIVIATVLVIAAFVGLAFHLRSAAAPIIDLRVFRSPRLAAATFYNFVLGSWMLTGGFLNALYFATVHDLPPLRIGELLLVGNIGDFVVIPLSAWFLKKLSAPPLIALGVLLIAAGFWMNAILGLDATFWDLVVPQLVRSAGASFLYVPVTIAAFDRLSEDERESAVGLFNLVRELGGSIAIALCAHLLIERSAVHADALGSITNRRLVHVQDLRVGRHLVELGGFADLFAGAAVLILLSLPLVLLFRAGRSRSRSLPSLTDSSTPALSP